MSLRHQQAALTPLRSVRGSGLSDTGLSGIVLSEPRTERSGVSGPPAIGVATACHRTTNKRPLTPLRSVRGSGLSDTGLSGIVLSAPRTERSGVSGPPAIGV